MAKLSQNTILAIFGLSSSKLGLCLLRKSKMVKDLAHPSQRWPKDKSETFGRRSLATIQKARRDGAPCPEKEPTNETSGLPVPRSRMAY
jgi:hypothetical protein